MFSLRCVIFLCLFLILSQAFSGCSRIISNKTESQINEEVVAKGYVVWNPSCRIPDINPYHESIKKYIFKWEPLICSKLKPLTSIAFNATDQRHTLKISPEAVPDYSSSMSSIVCCYNIVTRSYLSQRRSDSDDDRFEMSKAVCFKKHEKLPEKAENIYVACTVKKKTVYKTIHFVVVEKKPKPAPTVSSDADPNAKKKYSLLLFAIDSISRLNFIRTLPKTREFVEKRGWLTLEGYTKIADNTFPNLNAVLTGLNVKQLSKLCYHSPKKQVDDCPFMWKNYSQNGYLTSYTEDTASISSYNFQKYGFLNSPTDYYSRPIMVAAGKRMKIRDNGGMEYCIGQHPQIEYLFQFNTEFVQRFHDRPYFNLFWANSYSHNELNMPQVMDGRIRRFLEDVDGYLNSTVVVFFSDHGMRFGGIRETFVGWLEERMPFVYFHLPAAFQAAHPQWVRNLRANKNKLTSPFDLHLTLQQLLYGEVRQPAAGCPGCVSLLAPVPHNRSCDDAAIAPHWCTCSAAESKVAQTDARIAAAAHMAVGEVNELLRRSGDRVNAGHKCATLSLGRVTSVHTKSVAGFSLFRRSEYVIVFEAEPSKALFEITVAETTLKIGSLDEVSRINQYANQSSCVKTSGLLKLFCFCVKK